MGASYFLGVDGGATRCRARVRGCSGELLADAEGSAANIYVDFDGALAVVHEVVSRAMVGAGLSTGDRARTALGLGLAGVSGKPTAVHALGAPRIALVGGLADAIRPYLSAELDEMLRKPIFDAVDGAILLVGGALPKLAER